MRGDIVQLRLLKLFLFVLSTCQGWVKFGFNNICVDVTDDIATCVPLLGVPYYEHCWVLGSNRQKNTRLGPLLQCNTSEIRGCYNMVQKRMFELCV